MVIEQKLMKCVGKIKGRNALMVRWMKWKDNVSNRGGMLKEYVLNCISCILEEDAFLMN